MRRLIGMLVVLSLLLLAPVRAHAHGAGINAVLSTDPLNLTPGQPATIAVGLFDVYNSPIPGAHVRIQVEQEEHSVQPAAELHESTPGTYTGAITVAATGFLVLRVEAILPDGLWSAPLPVETGADGTKVWDMGVELLHQDAAVPVPPPSLPHTDYSWLVVVAVVLIGLLVITIKRRRGSV